MQPTNFDAFAFAFASRFHLGQVEDWFAGGPAMRRTKTQLVAIWGPNEMAIAFDFGALVFLNVPQTALQATLEAFSTNLTNEPHPPLREELVVEVLPGARVEVGFDRVRVPELTPVVFEVVATVIAQSVSLDYYDEDVQAELDRIHAIASVIAVCGKPPGRKREIVKFAFASIASQIEIISSLALLDKPDLTWDDALADELHDELRYAFEISERYRALEAKITASRQAFAAFLELTQSHRSLLLEATVVALILFEILLSLAKFH